MRHLERARDKWTERERERVKECVWVKAGGGWGGMMERGREIEGNREKGRETERDRER